MSADGCICGRNTDRLCHKCLQCRHCCPCYGGAAMVGHADRVLQNVRDACQTPATRWLEELEVPSESK